MGINILLEIDWKNFWLRDLDFSLALEIGIRTLIMFTFVLVFLRSSGKKGVRQLSIFEVAIIIALGSAAGDPMVSSESAILPSLLVFIVILLLYRLITYLTAKSQKIEMILEGDPMYIVEDGLFTMKKDGDANFAKDEFFAEMRVQNIEHLGQVRAAVLETNGQVSFLFYPDEQIDYGLPIFPKPYHQKTENIFKDGHSACTHCAKVVKIATAHICERCGKKEWVPAINTVRYT